MDERLRFLYTTYSNVTTVHLYTLNVWLIIWVCSKKVDACRVAVASVSFLSPAILNLSRNSNRNKTSTRYKVIIQFLRHSIANQG